MSEAAGTAVREKGHMTVLETERRGYRTCTGVIADAHDVALAEVVSASVRSELADFLLELVETAGLLEEVEARSERVVRPVVADVGRVFAAVGPVMLDPHGLADLPACAFNHS